MEEMIEDDPTFPTVYHIDVLLQGVPKRIFVDLESVNILWMESIPEGPKEPSCKVAQVGV